MRPAAVLPPEPHIVIAADLDLHHAVAAFAVRAAATGIWRLRYGLGPPGSMINAPGHVPSCESGIIPGGRQFRLNQSGIEPAIDRYDLAGVEFRLNADIGTDLSIEWMEAQFEAVFIGVGLGSSQRLGLPGGELEGVVDALHLLAECRQGRPRWASQVAVVGGGATATDAAIAMVKLGAAEVRMLYRRGEAEMRSFAFEFARAREAGVLLDFFVQPVAIHGVGAVAAIECVRMEMCPAPKGGRMLPMVVDGSNFRIDCEMVVTSIGQSKLVDLLAQQRGVALDDRGHIVIDPKNGQTTNARYFAGGDCVNGGREVVDAVAGGKRAAAGIADWLERYG